MTIHIRNATSDDIVGAARTLAAAFDEYQWTRWSVPSYDYTKRLTELQGIFLRHALDCGLVLVDEANVSVAAFLPPYAPEPSHSHQVRIEQLLGDRLPALLAARLPQPPPGSWNLATVGVHPENWGNGAASALLSEGIRRIEESYSADIALETSDPRNVRLYARHGFEVTATTAIPSGPTVFSMLRNWHG